MKKKTFRSILADGVALFMPIAVTLFLLKKIFEEFREFLAPVADKLGIEHFFGRFTLSIVAMIAIFIIILLLGLMMELPIIVRFRNAFESLLLKIFPPLNQLKVLFAEFLNREDATPSWKSVMLKEGEKYRFAFVVEESERMGVFYIMKSPNMKDGDIEMLEKDSYTYTEVDAVQMKMSMRNFGKDSSKLFATKIL